MIEFGSYARANNDTAATTWDNLVIESAGGATFAPTSLSVRAGLNSADVTVKIPAGANAQSPVLVKVVSSNPSIANAVGAVGDTLALTFAAGGSNTKTIKVHGVSPGGATFSLEGDVPGGNKLTVAVISGAGVRLTDDFSVDPIDPLKWQISNLGFETGTGTYTVESSFGILEINGLADSQYWGGASLKSRSSFVATKDLNLSVEVDRVTLQPGGTAARTSVFLTSDDRKQFVMFAQNLGENGWEVNTNPGNPTGGGTTIAAFSGVTDGDNHHIQMVADGETVEVFLDGVSGGKFPFAVTTGIFVELGAYARATGDTVNGKFDTVKIENVIACTKFSAASVSMTVADAGSTVSVTVPSLLHDAAAATVTITSLDPKVAVPEGGVNGSLTLTFGASAADTQSFQVKPVGKGSTTFTVTSQPANCSAGALAVEVVAVPQVLLSDDFSGDAVDTAKWTQSDAPFATGTATPESAITLEGGQVKINVVVDVSLWPGLALYTTETYQAGASTPVSFEINRNKLDFVLTTGTGAEERSGIWVKDGTGNFVFFNEYVAHDGRNFGWVYNKMTGEPDDDPMGVGVNIVTFDPAKYNDQGAHHLKLVANGSTVKLYLDGILGAEIPFLSAADLTFGFGAYADERGNAVTALFDNARVSGGETPFLRAAIAGNNVIISWTGAGKLEQSTTLLPGSWAAVTPAPAGNSITVPKNTAARRFYRLH